MAVTRNITYNIIGSVVPLVLALATVPLYLHVIGSERYGALAIAWLLLGYFGLFDFGLGRATTQRIAALKDATAQVRADTFWTALTINVVMGAIGAVVLFILTRYFFGEIFRIEEALRDEMIAALPVLALSVPIATITGVLSGALAGRERFLEINIANIASTILFLTVPLAVAWTGKVQLQWLVAASVFARFLGLGFFCRGVWQHVARGSSVRFARDQWRSLTAFGGWVGVSAIVSPMMTMFDRFIIGSTLGAKAVTIYTVPYQLASRFIIFPAALANVLFPRLSADSDIDNARAQSLMMTTTTLLLFAPPIIVAIGLMRDFLHLWLGVFMDDQSPIIGQIALFGFWLNGIAYMPFAFIQSRGNSRFTALLHLAELIPYFACLGLLGKYYGLPGVCAAFALRCGLDLIFLDRKAHGPSVKVPLEFIGPVVLIMATMLTTHFAHGPVMRLAATALFGAAASAWCLWRLPSPIRDRLFGMIKRGMRANA